MIITIGEIVVSDDEKKQGNKQETKSTYHLVNVKAIKNMINDSCMCRCTQHQEIDNFLNYCSGLDNQMTCEKMMELRKHGTNERQNHEEIKIRENYCNQGMYKHIISKMSPCCIDTRPKTTKFYGNKYCSQQSTKK